MNIGAELSGREDSICVLEHVLAESNTSSIEKQ
jgi:hypothetical protein